MHWGNAESMLQLNFTTVESGSGHNDKLMVNDVQIYPVTASIDRLATPLQADQVIEAPDGTWVYLSTQSLGYAVSMRRHHEATDKNLGLLKFNVEIIEVGFEFIRGIPSVDLSVIESKTGRLLIADVSLTMPKSSSPRPANGNKQECASMLCKWKAIFADKVASFKKGCGKAKGHGMPRPNAIKGGSRPNKFPHHRPHKGSFHHGRPHRQHRGVVASLIRNMFFYVIAPMLIGIFIGFLASVVGMFVGHLVVFAWRLFFRRGERGHYNRVKQEEASADCDDESKGFLEHEDAPPVYEDSVAVIEEKTEQK